MSFNDFSPQGHLKTKDTNNPNLYTPHSGQKVNFYFYLTQHLPVSNLKPLPQGYAVPPL